MPTDKETRPNRDERRFARLINEEVLERKVKHGVGLTELVISILELVVDAIAYFGRVSRKSKERKVKKLQRLRDKLIARRTKGHVLTPKQRKMVKRLTEAIDDLTDDQGI